MMGSAASLGNDLEIIVDVDRQPLFAATDRLAEALAFAGTPLDPAVVRSLRDAKKIEKDSEAVRRLQEILDPLCIAEVNINAESRVKVKEGSGKKELIEQGWRTMLIKVHNEAGINPQLVVESPNAAPVYEKGRMPRQKPRTDQDLVDPEDVMDRWLDVTMLNRQPMKPRLSGLAVEYRVVLLYSRDAGQREGSLAFNVGQGTQDLGFRNAIPILFDCQESVEVKLSVRDENDRPTTAAFVITDGDGRIYPNPAKRLAPDFFFHQQVYRADGESVRLPPGDYTINVTRGPEYIPQTLRVNVPDAKRHQLTVQLKRWIHLASQGWYSGDHHVHAAGCAHYDSPTEGVGPEDMMRHLIGEDLNVGCVLSWGPCWYTQKQFFEGRASALSTDDYLMRYDVEVSGFPSSHAGHLCLLKLAEDDYPGTEVLEDWPSWTVPVLQWGQEQGGVVGYSHSGWGLELPDHMPDGTRKFARARRGPPRGWTGEAVTMIPDYAMPPFDGIGANEYIVATALGACDFNSTVDTPSLWELNIWYHTLNCGMTSRISGETDFPCIYGERVGLGRIYVQLDDDQQLNYDNWVAGLKDGRSYCGDGLSHIIDFEVDGLGVGKHQAPESPASRLDVAGPSTMHVTFDAAAMLEPKPTAKTEAIRQRRLDQKPFWHIERCRIDDSRDVPIEVIVNGEVAAVRSLTADGTIQSFDVPVELNQSSWVAVRILPSVHTNPVFVHMNDEPIRANKRSAKWCLEAVGQCWESKKAMIREEERDAAKRGYDKAAAIYRDILGQFR